MSNLNRDLCRYCQNVPVAVEDLYCSNQCENLGNIEFIKYTIDHSMNMIKQVARNLEPCIKKLQDMERKQ
jgi:hypothetical protein